MDRGDLHVIDFRYHVVSIVAVFLALAVGIVLGAGPLKEDLGSTLTAQVTQLRNDKTALRDQLKQTEQGVSSRDTYAKLVAPAVIADKLTDDKVALVLLPGADGGLVKKISRTLSNSGATVATTIKISDTWTDAGQASKREDTVTPLARLVGIEPTVISSEKLPGAVLSRALFGTGKASKAKNGQNKNVTQQVLAGLGDGGMISFDPAHPTPVTGVVIVAGSLPNDTTDREAQAGLELKLLESLGGKGRPAVLVSGQQSGQNAAAADPLVAALRSDTSTSSLVSTVDDGDLPMGQSTMVLALRDEYDGSTGHFGLAADASAVAPQIPGS